MARFFPLRVTNIDRLTPNSVAITLDSGAEKTSFDFIPGQYLTFKVWVAGAEYRRSYSICSSTNDQQLTIGVKEVPNGTVSVFLNEQLKVGDELQSMAPMGHFHPNEAETTTRQHFVFFAAGSGITPILSIIKWALAHPLQHKVTLFYGNTSRKTCMFHDELSELTQSHDGLDVIHVYTDRSIGSPTQSGRIDFQKTWDLMKTFVQDDLHKSFFVCGPSAMMKSVSDGLKELGHSSDAIHMEHFSEPDVAAEPKAEISEPSDFNGDAEVTIRLDGGDTTFGLKATGDVVLDAALDQGLDAPYSCKGGVCTTCRAKVTAGKVEMENNYALTDEEIEEGYVLTCQTHPASAKVTISYDD